MTDVVSRVGELLQKPARSARFKGPKSHRPAEPVHVPETGEHAARPNAVRASDVTSQRREVLDAFLASCVRDAAQIGDSADVSQRSLVTSVMVAEALGRWDEALHNLVRLGKSHGIRGDEWAVARRVYRALNDDAAIQETLDKELHERPDGSLEAILLNLEIVSQAWRVGQPVRVVHDRINRVAATARALVKLPALAALWAMQLKVDTLVEGGRVEAAIDILFEMAAHTDLPPETRAYLKGLAAVWLNALGRTQDAIAAFESMGPERSLVGDIEEAFGSVFFEFGHLSKAFDVMVGARTRWSGRGTAALTLAMLFDLQRGDAAAARDVLRSATDADGRDATLLRARQNLLEREAGRGRDAGAELIDVLNMRLEGALATDERVDLLTRLGHHYELEAGLEEAAAEVYREALEHSPDHAPALRALGRLYTRRGNWQGLVQLYEREMALAQHPATIWRRHFQTAEIYEARLANPEKALEHFHQVLARRPGYLPAIKAATRILSRQDRWTELANLLLATVDHVTGRREKLFLLERVAEIAEFKLKNVDVAIRAWEALGHVESDSPRVFSALARLYERSKRWSELVALYVREIATMSDPEEVASVYLRCAELAIEHLGSDETAEQYYRKALSAVPDFLPAMEGLGRMYVRGGRWAEIVDMSGRELSNIADRQESIRQMGAMAELFETIPERRKGAINLYEEMYRRNPHDHHIHAALLRLHRSEGHWARVQDLLATQLNAHSEPARVAATYGEMAQVAEWHANDIVGAYSQYLLALQFDPTNLHWLEGVLRSWARAKQSPDVVADTLEDLLAQPLSAAVRERYFAVIARLRDRADRSPEASRAYRAHGSADNLENQMLLRLAMGQGAERDTLAQARRQRPHHAVEGLVDMPRRDLGPTDLRRLTNAMSLMGEEERTWMLAQLDVRASYIHVQDDASRDALMTRDLMRALSAGRLFEAPCDIDEPLLAPELCRLRALEARQSSAYDAYARWTRAEIARASSRELAVHRLLEMAAVASEVGVARVERGTSLHDFYDEAASCAFGELATGETMPDTHGSAKRDRKKKPYVDGPTLDMLYEALGEASEWKLLRRCLEAHAGRAGLNNSRRLYLFKTLAEVLQHRLGDLDAARGALQNCWQHSEDPAYLRELVLLSLTQGSLADGVRFQQRHFERVMNSGQFSADEKVQSGLWLSELLLRDGDRQQDGLDCLEFMLANFPGSTRRPEVVRSLARAHMKFGNPRRAVALFESVLTATVLESELEDWRALVELYARNLGEVRRGYELQWRIVRIFPESAVDLNCLVDLAIEADEIQGCVAQLERLARTLKGVKRVALLARAAEALDEDLGWHEDAARLYTELVELTAQTPERRAYFSRRRAFCLAHLSGREDEALEEFRRLVAWETFEAANYRGLMTLFQRSQSPDRLRVAHQILVALGCEEDEGPMTRTKMRPSRTIDRELVEANLLPESLQDGVLDVLRSVAPVAERIWADQLPQHKLYDGMRLKPESGPVLEVFEAAFDAFGFKKFRVHVGDHDASSPQIFPDSNPYVWINRELLANLNDAELRFMAGYCAALAWTELPSLLALDGRRVWHLLEGIWFRQSGHAFGDRLSPASEELADSVASPFHAGQRRKVLAALEPRVADMATAEPRTWSRAVEDFACRVGLLFCGDVASATRCMMRLEGWDLPLADAPTQVRVRENDLVASLIRFALSEEYLDTRHYLGLSGRPSVIKL